MPKLTGRDAVEAAERVGLAELGYGPRKEISLARARAIVSGEEEGQPDAVWIDTSYLDHPDTAEASPGTRLSPGESTHVQFRCAMAVRLAVLSRAESEGLTEREAWEAAGRAWANGG